MNTYAYVDGNPVLYADPYGLTKITFYPDGSILIIDPEVEGRDPYSVPATSGDPECGCDETTKKKGPIPKGNYNLYADQLSNPGTLGDLARNTQGDWGDWRVPLKPTSSTNTHGRDGFFLHGGGIAGSAGCIDVGGGLSGNAITDQILSDILNDPDGKIQVRVR